MTGVRSIDEHWSIIVYLDAVYWMDVFHAVKDYPSDLLQALVGSHNTDSASLDKYIALSQQLNCLDSR